MNNNNVLFYHFFKDLIEILKEKLIENNKEVKTSTNESDKLFNKGRLLSYYDVITLIKSQAVSFNIELGEIGLSDFNADEFMV